MLSSARRGAGHEPDRPGRPGLLAAAGTYPANYLLNEYLPYFILMAWSEAVLTGMVMTMMVSYRPEWVCTFDDARYIRNK